MTMARAHLIDPSAHPLVSLRDTLRPTARSCSGKWGKDRSTAKNGSSNGCKNLRKSSPLPSAGFRSWTTICTSSCDSTPRSAQGWSDEEVA